MNSMWLHKRMIYIGIFFAVFVSIESAAVKYGGTPVDAPNIPRQPQVLGSGRAINYLVLGDSTSIGQGADYQAGIAIGTAKHLAQKGTVSMINLGVSGARSKDVQLLQLPKITQKPDVVLIAIGANDVTHITPLGMVKQSLQATTEALVKLNCNVKIVFTGSPAMGSVHRFPQPLRLVAGYRANQVNRIFTSLNDQYSTTLAPLAAKTGTAFAEDISLSAQDKFHPSAAGYALWVDVLNKSLDEALANQPSHCN